MRADSFLGRAALAVSRRTPAFNPGHGCGPAVAAELRTIADAYDQYHEDAVARIKRGDGGATGLVRAYAVRDQLRERAAELDPQGGEPR